jgi:FkbM family methyltransferase
MVGLTTSAIRSLRFLRRIRGWHRIAGSAASSSGQFEVFDDGVVYKGDLSSFIDREIYLFGGYEAEQIAAFLALIPISWRGTIIDIGANSGNHTLRFASAFSKVIAFEPNPRLWEQLNANVNANGFDHVTLYPLGVSDREGTFPLYDLVIGNGNLGLASLLSDEQYGEPMRQIAHVRCIALDEFLAGEHIDALKIDVQGAETSVLRGMRRILERDAPFVWVELGGGCHNTDVTREELVSLFPYPIRILRFGWSGRFARKMRLTECEGDRLLRGDHIIVRDCDSALSHRT